MAKKNRKKKLIASMATSVEELKALQQFGQTPPWSFIESISALICKYIALQWKDGLEAKDVFIMSRLLHLSVSTQLNHDLEEVSAGIAFVNVMTEEEEVIMARNLDMIATPILKSIDKMDEV